MTHIRTLISQAVCAAVLLLSFAAQAQQIHVNQIGYGAASMKVAAVPSPTSALYRLHDHASGEVVFTDSLSAARKDSYSGETVAIADFTQYTVPGTYYIQSGLMKSYPFSIQGGGLYTALSRSSLRGFYYWRASMAIDSAYAWEGADNFARPMGHPDTRCIIHSSAADTIRKAGDIFSAPKGWYDAGDYNKYVINAVPPMFSLLHAYELNPAYYDLLDLNIPESTNDIPDILDEIKYEADWLLAMQDPNDGGVYFKLTSKNFCGTVMPHADNLERYLIKKSTSSALDFAGIMAKTYRVFKDVPALALYAEECLAAAKKAYGWAEKHPNILYRNPTDIKTGEYGDSNISDEFFYARAELFLATGDRSYYEKLSLNQTFEVPSWNRVETFGLLSLASQLPNIDIPQADKDKIASLVISLGKTYYSIGRSSAFRNMGIDFMWGGNGAIAGRGMVAYCAYRLGGGEELLSAAEMSLHYLLGQNALGLSFVTGFGSKSTRRPHDRRSESDGIGAPIPGYVAGGANASPAKDCSSGSYPSSYPAKRYYDAYCSYSTNEIAINWNGPLAFVSGALDAESTDLRISPSMLESNGDGSQIFIRYPADILLQDAGIQSFTVRNGIQALAIDSVRQTESTCIALYLGDSVQAQYDSLSIAYSGVGVCDVKGRKAAEYHAPVFNRVAGGPAYLLSATAAEDGASVDLLFSKKVAFSSFSPAIVSIASAADQYFHSIASTKDSTVIRVATSQFYRDQILLVSLSPGAKAADGGAVLPAAGLRAENMSIPFPPVPVYGATLPDGFSIELIFDKNIVQDAGDNAITVKIKNSEGTKSYPAKVVKLVKQNIRLSIAERIYPGDTLTVSYSSGGLESEYDKPVPAFADYWVQNMIVAPLLPFVIDSVAVSHIQAEKPWYHYEVGTKSCTDVGGGLYSYLPDARNWTEYRINAVTAGQYDIQMRVASTSFENTIDIHSIASTQATPLGSYSFGHTGGLQEWQTVAGSISLQQGDQYLRVFSADGLVNLNWLKIAKHLELADAARGNRPAELFAPNPASGQTNSYIGASEAFYQLHDESGTCIQSGYIAPGSNMHYPQPGLYLIHIDTEHGGATQQIIVQ